MPIASPDKRELVVAHQKADIFMDERTNVSTVRIALPDTWTIEFLATLLAQAHGAFLVIA
ncbi:MAG: hypothetical protein SVM79_08930 [Chloroflexota bacterium]|nr:hypothetical protein [Chloroflexota bacterium]